jgi:RimJ/RimL family protein N-acetyltransferase
MVLLNYYGRISKDYMQHRQIDVVRSLKALDQEEGGSKNILIRNMNGVVIGKLVPIDEKLIDDQIILVALTSWRKKFKLNFLTQFEPTIERTKKWLSEVVLKDDTRVLFLIFDNTGRAIGNLGVCNIAEHQAELDNVLRGEKAGEPNFMFHTEIAMLGWLYWVMGVDLVVLHVFSNNEKAINLYTKVGFTERQRFNLSKIQEGDDIKHFVGSGKGDPVDFQYIEMILEKSRFESFIEVNNERK